MQAMPKDIPVRDQIRLNFGEFPALPPLPPGGRTDEGSGENSAEKGWSCPGGRHHLPSVRRHVWWAAGIAYRGAGVAFS